MAYAGWRAPEDTLGMRERHHGNAAPERRKQRARVAAERVIACHDVDDAALTSAPEHQHDLDAAARQLLSRGAHIKTGAHAADRSAKYALSLQRVP